MHSNPKQGNEDGHQRATHTNLTLIDYTDHNGQHDQVNRPPQKKMTEKPQEHTHHEEILSIQINNTHKSTYNAKVANTEATALFNSGAVLSCISKWFYDRIHQVDPAMVINTNARPPVVITSASVDELTNLGQCKLCIKLSPKTFETTFRLSKTWNET